MSLKFTCPVCGTKLGYKGLCWKCQAEHDRQDALAWTGKQIAEKQQLIMKNIHALEEMEDPEFTAFCQLLSYHNAITAEIQRLALKEKIYYPCEIYYQAPEDVREGLISALLNTDDSNEAGNLLSCLAMQGDDQALAVLVELERNPRPWRKKLYVGPSVYAQCGGWTFDEQGERVNLNYDICYPMVKRDAEDSPVKIGHIREDVCPHCGGKMVDILVLDGRDERLKFLGIEGIITVACCPNCVGFFDGSAFNRFTLDGKSEVLPAKLFDGADKMDCYMQDEDYALLANNTFGLAEKSVPLFYGAFAEDINTIGGFANWVQDWEYVICPNCGKTMKYLAQIQWSTVLENMEGTLYIEICPDCKIVSMQHQQT